MVEGQTYQNQIYLQIMSSPAAESVHWQSAQLSAPQ